MKALLRNSGLIFLGVLTLGTSLLAQTDLARKSAEVDKLLAPWNKKDSPGAAVIVIKDGRVLHRKGYGLANRKTRQFFQADTPSLIGSVSKQFTAVAILMLTEQGKLSLDDPLAKFFPQFPPYVQTVTIRHLLHHTSGLPVFEDVLKKGKAKTSAEALALLSQQPALRFGPGARFEYNNGNYVLLSHVIERLSEKDYATFMEERIFRPLGMNNTFISCDETRLKTAPRAIGYYREWYGLKVSEWFDTLKLFNGAGSLFSTVEDMAQWDQALLTEKLVKAATLEQAFTRGRLNDGTSTHYGFGWEIYRYKGVRYTIHPGGWGGFKAFILRFPDQRFAVIALSNSGQFDISGLPMAIARIYLCDEIAVPTTIVN